MQKLIQSGEKEPPNRQCDLKGGILLPHGLQSLNPGWLVNRSLPKAIVSVLPTPRSSLEELIYNPEKAGSVGGGCTGLVPGRVAAATLKKKTTTKF